jgi:uncharacterized membrane protein
MISKKHYVLIVLFVIFIGLVLRLYRLNYQSFWNDEIITIYNTNISIHDMIVNPRDINILPLYYIIIYPIMRLHIEESLLRFPSMIFGLMSVVLFYLVIHHLFHSRIQIGLIGTVIMAVSPFHIWYSQEARPYIVLLFFSLLSLLLVQMIIQGKSNLWLRLCFVISTAATFYCHTVAIAFIGFLAIYVLIWTPRSQWRDWLLLFGAVALLLTPGIYRLLIIPPVGTANPLRSTSLLAIPYAMWVFSTGYSLGPSLSELHTSGPLNTLFPYIPIIFPLMVFFSGLSLFGALRLLRHNRSLFWTILLWFLFPCAFGILGSVFTRHPFNVRYIILSFPAFVIFLAVGVFYIKSSYIRIMSFSIIIVVSTFSLMNYYFDERYHRDNNRAAGQYLTTHALPDDLVLVSAAYTAPNLRYYYRGTSEIHIRGYPRGRDFAEIPSNRRANGELTSTFPAKATKIDSDLEAIIGDRERFWLFLSRTFHSDPKGRIRTFLDERYCRVLQAAWVGTELILYRARSTQHLCADTALN